MDLLVKNLFRSPRKVLRHPYRQNTFKEPTKEPVRVSKEPYFDKQGPLSQKLKPLLTLNPKP